MLDQKINNQQIANILADAFSLDVQIFIENSLKSFRDSTNGQAIYSWANNNRLIFELGIRMLSSIIQQQKVSDKTAMSKIIFTQIERLPREIQRTFVEDKNVIQISKNTIVDKDFNERFELALEDFEDDDLKRIVKLTESQRIEFVNAPKKLRKFMIEQWTEPTNFRKSFDKSISKFNEDSKSFFQRETWLEKKVNEISEKKARGEKPSGCLVVLSFLAIGAASLCWLLIIFL